MSGDHVPPIAKRGEKPTTPQQAALIALAEYEYWRNEERTDITIPAMAAAANIYSAIEFGIFAPWHPGYPKQEPKPNENQNDRTSSNADNPTTDGNKGPA